MSDSAKGGGGSHSRKTQPSLPPIPPPRCMCRSAILWSACAYQHGRDAEEVESHCSSPAYQLKLEQILCVQKPKFRSSSIHPTVRIRVNHSHRLAVLHFQHQGERHSVYYWKKNTHTHTEVFSSRANMEENYLQMIRDDSDLLLSDDKCYFWKQNISMTKTTYCSCESPHKRKENIDCDQNATSSHQLQNNFCFRPVDFFFPRTSAQHARSYTEVKSYSQEKLKD